MAVGNQATSGIIDAQLTTYSLTLRNVFQNILNLNEFIGSVGTAGLEALGYSAADAATAQAFAGNLATLAAIYQGQAVALGLPFNFQADTFPLWAGQ
jgi:hypothetical protein